MYENDSITKTHEEFYDLLRGYVKDAKWLKLTCHLGVDKDDNLVIFGPKLERDEPSKND